jgi:AraC-like DNA-binding protein
VEGFTNDKVAQYLSFNDAANLRRSLKRWLGRTPNLIRQLFSS